MEKRKHCTEDLREIRLNLYREGKSVVDIAGIVKRSLKLVYNALKHFSAHKTTRNVARKQRARKKTEKEDIIIH